MKRIRIIGLCLVAVFAFSAIGAASAYAEPEFTNSTHAFPLGFTSKGGVAKLTTANHTIECEKVLDTGEILAQPSSTSSMLGDIEFHFHKCKSLDFGAGECSNTSTKGLILTPVYLFHLGSLVVLGSERHVLILILVSKTNFECESLIGNQKVSVEGNLVGLFAKESQFNHRAKEIEVVFEQTAAGKQRHTTFEFTLPKSTNTGLHLSSSLNGGAAEEAAEVASGTELINNNGEVELKA